MGNSVCKAWVVALIVIVAAAVVIGAVAAHHHKTQAAVTTTRTTTPATTTVTTTSRTTTTTVTTSTLATRSTTKAVTSTTSKAVGKAIVLRDFRGKEIILEHPARRIVVIGSYWAEVLQAIGAGDRIVGVGSWVPYDHYLPESIRSKPRVGDLFKGVNVEEVAALKPDLVIMDYGYGKASEIISKLEEMKIPVLALFASSFKDQLRAIELIANATGLSKRGLELVKFMESRYELIKKIASEIPSSKRVTAVMISGYSIIRGKSLSLYANTSWGRSLVDAGAINLAIKYYPNTLWPKIDFETLLKWNPDVILITSSVRDIPYVIEKIESSKEWHLLKAYKNDKIYIIPVWGSIGGVLDWGPRSIIGRELIASILYPSYYKSIDWRSDMEYLLSHYYGLFIPKQAFALYNLKWKQLVDVTNHTVVVPENVSRIIDLITYKLMLCFNATKLLVGVSKYAKHDPLMRTAYPGIVNVTSPGSSWSLNIEEVAALKPDVVLIWPFKESIVKSLEEIHVPIVRVELKSYNDIIRQIWFTGALLNKLGRAEEIVSEMNKLVKLVESRVSSIPLSERVRVLYLWSKPTKVQGGTGTTNDFIVMAGGVNVAAKEFPNRAYVSVDLEKIIKWNPQLIVVWWYAKYNVTKEILENPQWQSIDAVKHHRVYREPYFEHWGPDSTLFILWLAKKMYPSRFSDINWTSIADKYYREWYGVPYQAVVEAAMHR